MEHKKIIYVDIDGTICDTPFRLDDIYDIDKTTHYSQAVPHYSRIDVIYDLYDKGHNITYWTARGSVSGIDFTELTRNQLEEWGCKYHHLVVGTKPHFDMYICDKSFNSESFFHYKERELP
jgi:uncharacterized HAD superfamily protein